MLQRWWNLSKLVTITFVNFGNSFNSISSLPFLLRKKISSKNAVWEEWNGQLPSAWRMMIKTWGRVLLGGMIKNEQIQFFYWQMYCNNLETFAQPWWNIQV